VVRPLFRRRSCACCCPAQATGPGVLRSPSPPNAGDEAMPCGLLPWSSARWPAVQQQEAARASIRIRSGAAGCCRDRFALSGLILPIRSLRAHRRAASPQAGSRDCQVHRDPDPGVRSTPAAKAQTEDNKTRSDKGGRVANSGRDDASDQREDHWDRLEAFLHTDPQDAGCDRTMEMLDVYAELVAAGADPAERFPGIRAHLLACGPCAEDLEGLLSAIVDGSSPRSDAP
jgi:hypothetical protein